MTWRTCSRTSRGRSRNKADRACLFASKKKIDGPEMKSFHIDCEIEYDVTQQTLFIFNLGVPTTSAQVVRAESIVAQPNVVIDEFHDAGGINRFFRLDVPPGRLNMRYLAT